MWDPPLFAAGPVHALGGYERKPNEVPSCPTETRDKLQHKSVMHSVFFSFKLMFVEILNIGF